MYKYTSNPDRAIALADCNNFFASCERRVNPLLENRPVVVLSCNDGCVIARSNEVEKIGIKMGEPYFRIKDTLKYYNVAVRSTNMPLYQEVSAEVMARIKIYTDAIEQYSIDECFFNMGIANITDPVAYCLRIRKDILCKCRIPVSIGIAPTKTLCKLAAEYAKHHDDSGGVYWLSSEKYNDYDYMSQFKCGDVWGIGNKTEKKLALQGVRNAAEFTRLDEVRVLKEYSVRGLFTLWELRGRPSIPFELERKPQKSIMVSRSFGNVLHTEYELLDPLWCFVVAAGRQLRKEGLAAGKLAVYIMTSWFAPEDRRYYKSAEVVFQTPKFLDYDLMTAAASAMRQIYVRGYDYNLNSTCIFY